MTEAGRQTETDGDEQTETDAGCRHVENTNRQTGRWRQTMRDRQSTATDNQTNRETRQTD